MLGLDIAEFVIGTVADVWGIRADHLDIKKAKQEQKKEEKTVYPLEQQFNIENKLHGQPTGDMTENPGGYKGELPRLGRRRTT